MNNGYKCKSISAVPSGQLKKEESVHYFKSHFCPKCGTEFGDKESES